MPACDGCRRVLFILQAGQFGFAAFQLGGDGFQRFRFIGHGESRHELGLRFLRLAPWKWRCLDRLAGLWKKPCR
jgi:hypothetical protein